MNVTKEQLAVAMQCPVGRAAKWVDAINLAMEEFGIDSQLRTAHFLAQLAHESGRLLYVRELASGSAYDKRADLGNTKKEAIDIAWAHGSLPGAWWKGHGPIQITGYDNHLACGKALGYDLLNNPRQLEDYIPGARAAGWFWTTRNLNDLADQDLLTMITRRINGGLNGLEDRRALLLTAKKAVGL